MATNYRRGADFERRICALLDAAGYYTVSSRGSHGIADVVAVKHSTTYLIQCKINGRISPADRTALYDVCVRVGALPVVAYRPTPRKIAYKRLCDPAVRGGLYDPLDLTG